MRTSSAVIFDGKEYEVTRAKLRVWLQLEDIREQTARAADNKNKEELIASIYSYLSVALSVQISFADLPWHEIAEAYADIVALHRPFFDFPFLSTAEKDEKVPAVDRLD